MDTHFSCGKDLGDWPAEFAVITAYATTGENWTVIQNEQADAELKSCLEVNSTWMKRLIGYSPDTGHSEPGWATNISWEQACYIGKKFKQDAIYYVSNNTLTVSYCDNRREPVYVSEYLQRLTSTD
jgi:carbohydrate-binding DOMON domain-containing protein